MTAGGASAQAHAVLLVLAAAALVLLAGCSDGPARGRAADRAPAGSRPRGRTAVAGTRAPRTTPMDQPRAAGARAARRARSPGRA